MKVKISALILCLFLITTGCGGGSSGGNGGDNGSNSGSEPTIVTFNTLAANGSSTETTTALTLTFNEAITGLSANDITLGGMTVTKGALSGAGPTYTLNISGVTTGGTLSVSVTKAGYDITGASKTVAIYYYNNGGGDNGGGDNGGGDNGGGDNGGGDNGGGDNGGGDNGGGDNGGGEPEPIAVTFSGLSANGSATETTTQLTLTFGQAIAGLGAGDITLSGAEVTKGALTGSGPTYTLNISGVSSNGTLTVSVSKDGYNITGGSQTATIYYYVPPIEVTFSSALADGSSIMTTSSLILSFSQEIAGLTANDIELSGMTGITKGDLINNGSTHELPIYNVTTGGTLTISVAKDGYNISGSPKTANISYYSPTCITLRAPEGLEIPIVSIDDLLAIPESSIDEYILMDDISLSSIPNWAPIKDFQGKFDGNGCVISDLTIDADDVQQIGFFGILTGATIHELALEDVDITVSGSNIANVGAIAAIATNITNITNSYATGKINVTVSDFLYVGGLVGYAKQSKWKNCYSTIDITGNEYAVVGGILGLSQANEVINSYSAGNLSGYYAGGVAGTSMGTTILNSYSTGTVRGTLSDLLLGSGGIIGTVGQSSSSVKYSYSTATVSDPNNAGGILGTDNNVSPSDGSKLTGVVAINPSVTAPKSGRIAPDVDYATITLLDGLALDTMAGNFDPSEPGYGTSTTEAKLKTKAAYEAIDWLFGNDDDNPWVMRGGYPMLYWQIGDGDYVVNFDTDGGTYLANSVAVVKEEPIPTKEDHIFKGWYDNPRFTGEAISFPYTPTQDTTLYAKWEPDCGRALRDGETAITTAAELAAITGNGKYLVMNDISLSSIPNWVPIKDFQGKFDGNCYAISDLTTIGVQEGLNDRQAGLFSTLDGATVTKLVLANVDISATGSTNAYAGAIAAKADNSTIRYSTVGGKVSASAGNTVMAGGLVGTSGVGSGNSIVGGGLTVENSYNSVEVTVTGAYSVGGGIAGYMYKGKVTGGHNMNKVVGNAAGGIVGAIVDSTVTESSNMGMISATSGAGGIAASMDNSIIERSYSTGNVSAGVAGGVSGVAGGVSGIAGGIAGGMKNSSIIRNSYSTGTIENGSEFSIAGGIAGNADKDCKIQYSYSSATVGTRYATSRAGGIFGGFTDEPLPDPLPSVSNSVAINPGILASGGGTVARIVPFGVLNTLLPLSNNLGLQFNGVDGDGVDKMIIGGSADGGSSVYTQDYAGALDGAHGLTKTKVELQTQSTYEEIGWLFGNDEANPWRMPESGYPVLYWEGKEGM